MPIDASAIADVAGHVARYFRDFLETDFKRRGMPRRRVQWQTDTGFRCGLRVADYPSMAHELWKLISRPIKEMQPLVVKPRGYTRTISSTMHTVIVAQIRQLPDTTITQVRAAVLASAQVTVASGREHPERWIDQQKDRLDEQVAEKIVTPLLQYFDGVLREQAYSLIDSLFAAESDLVARITAPLKFLLPSALSELLASGSPAALQKACDDGLQYSTVVQTLSKAFAEFQTADAYTELHDLATYVSTQDQLQLYLYLGVLGYEKRRYPLCYIPVQIGRDNSDSQYELSLDSHLLVNRRAIAYVVEQLAERAHREWVDPTSDRICYVAPEQSVYEVMQPIYRSVANACDLAGQTQFGSREPAARTSAVSLAPLLSLNVYESSEDALLNDYEQILDELERGGSEIVDLFQGIVRGVLLENPQSIDELVEAEYDQLPITAHMVDDAPVPLNEEQRKILIAVRAHEGKIIVVEGPPGTGKSHTIAAIAADCAFRECSCLVLSDKAEALDVVEDKVTGVMSQARGERDFPNPVLRLGQRENNFSKLVSNQTMTQVKAYVRAAQAGLERLKSECQQATASLEKDIDATALAFESIALNDVTTWLALEQQVNAELPDLAGAFNVATNQDLATVLAEVSDQFQPLREYLGGVAPPRTYERIRRDALVCRFAKSHALQPLANFQRLDSGQNRELSNLIADFRALRQPLIGYLLRGSAVRALNANLNMLPTRSPLDLRSQADELAAAVPLVHSLEQELGAIEQATSLADVVAMLSRNMIPSSGSVVAERMIALGAPSTRDFLRQLLNAPSSQLDRVLQFAQLGLKLRMAFQSAPDLDYPSRKRVIEQLNTALMNNRIDSRLVRFVEEHRADARAIAGVIRNRQKFPADKFAQVREAFPVIIASIRDFGEFMPLVPKLFDVVVLDEASQISVAQALPALLRAKKVVVLGDSKQYSNVKAAGARIDVNDKYKADLREVFRSKISQQADALERVSRFDIKCSILEFANLCASFAIMLRKHFRSYPELIDYSSQTFYGGQLQALKIRGVPLPDVIRFDQVSADPAPSDQSNTNPAEVQFILDSLIKLLDEDDPPTVGVITPFREQHTLITQRLFGHARGREFEDRLRLKVMTFDSAQGEERGVIFYSMVASLGHDALNYVFPADVHFDPDNVEEKLKVQRLNVGFSRAQEMVWFVTSMPIDSFHGAIGQALRHFHGILEQGEIVRGTTDPKSPMEKKVAAWLEECEFVRRHREQIEIIPQFPLGMYLRQLDPHYNHPAWKVDFLLTFQNSRSSISIVIEYDGFEYHFDERKSVHAGNYDRYMNGSDVERQLTLESYGYRFMRLNRFNLGTDPIQTISNKLQCLIRDADSEPTSDAANEIQRNAEGLINRMQKQCTRCNEIKPVSEFYDPALGDGRGGEGRVCMKCKNVSRPPVAVRRRWTGRRRY